MADKLAVYNAALALLGDRPLSALTDDTETRKRLDDVYESSVNYIAVRSKPRWAVVLKFLSATGTLLSYNNATLDTDVLTIVNVYEDATFSRKNNRWYQKGRDLYWDNTLSNVYLVTISTTVTGTESNWDWEFTDLVIHYLAYILSPRVGNVDTKALLDTFEAKITAVATEYKRADDPTVSTNETAYGDIFKTAASILGKSINDPNVLPVFDDVILGAIKYCAELTDPKWARKVSHTSTFTATAYGYKYATKPANTLTVTTIYTDQNLDQEYTRWREVDSDQIIVDNSVTELWIEYIDSTVILTASNYDPGFADLASHYLAYISAARLDITDISGYYSAFKERVSVVTASYADPDRSTNAANATNATTYNAEYSDAALILGVDVNDEKTRQAFDQAISSGIIDGLLEDYKWRWGAKVSSVTGVDNTDGYGYGYKLAVPTDARLVIGIYSDQEMEFPVEFLRVGDYIYTSIQTALVYYVSSTFLSTPSSWPTYFKRLVAAHIALATGPILNKSTSNAEQELMLRRISAGITDGSNHKNWRKRNGSWADARWNFNN